MKLTNQELIHLLKKAREAETDVIEDEGAPSGFSTRIAAMWAHGHQSLIPTLWPMISSWGLGLATILALAVASVFFSEPVNSTTVTSAQPSPAFLDLEGQKTHQQAEEKLIAQFENLLFSF